MNMFFKRLIETAFVVGAVYAIGKAAYNAGKESGRVEAEYEMLKKRVMKQTASKDEKEEANVIDIPLPKKKSGKLATLFKARKIYKEKGNIIGSLITDPEAHKLEAYISDGEIHVNVKAAEKETA